MNKEEINAVISSAEHGADSIIAIAKHNINNQTGLLVRKVFGNRFQIPGDKGAYLTTVSCETPKHKDVDSSKLVYVEGESGRDARELTFTDCLNCYELVLETAKEKAASL